MYVSKINRQTQGKMQRKKLKNEIIEVLFSD